MVEKTRQAAVSGRLAAEKAMITYHKIKDLRMGMTVAPVSDHRKRGKIVGIGTDGPRFVARVLFRSFTGGEFSTDALVRVAGSAKRKRK